MKVVVTIPAYNEEKTIGKVIENIKKVMDDSNYKYKILVIDDGSKDNTVGVAKRFGAVVYSHPRNYGLAEAFKTEIEKALSFNPEIILHIDADGQYRPKEALLLIKEVEKGYDLVLGSRFKGKIESMSLIKRLGNKAFSNVISNVTGFKINDTQTGFRAFTKKVAENIKLISTHTYTQEQIIKAVKSKFKIKEVPVHFDKRLSGKSRLIKNPIDYAVKAWISILRIYRDYDPLKFFGVIGTFFLIMGLGTGVWFVYLHFTTGIQGHLGLLMLMLLSIISGIQIIIFGFLADMRKQ